MNMMDKLVEMHVNLDLVNNNENNFIIRNIKRFKTIRKTYKSTKSELLNMKVIESNDIIDFCKMIKLAKDLGFEIPDDEQISFKIHSYAYPVMASITVFNKIDSKAMYYSFMGVLNENKNNSIEVVWRLKSDIDNCTAKHEYDKITSTNNENNIEIMMNTSYNILKNAMTIGFETIFDSIKEKYLK